MPDTPLAGASSLLFKYGEFVNKANGLELLNDDYLSQLPPPCLQETSTLADRLIHDQVRYARQEEEVFILKNDLSCTRHTSQAATQKLNESRAEYEQLKEVGHG